LEFDFFVSLSARLRENGWTDLHEIFREGVADDDDDDDDDDERMCFNVA